MSPLLNSATNIRLGNSPATVYQGNTKVWPTVVAYNLFTGTPTPVDSAVENTDFVFGTEFYVNKSGCYVTKVRYLHPTVGTLAPRTMALYSTTNGSSGTKVGGDWTMPTPTSGQWCTYTLPTRIALVANTRYRIATLHPANQGFPRTFDYFSSGPGGTTTTYGGYLVRPAQGQTLNTAQGSYYINSVMTFPSSVYRYSGYYSDVEVVDV